MQVFLYKVKKKKKKKNKNVIEITPNIKYNIKEMCIKNKYNFFKLYSRLSIEMNKWEFLKVFQDIHD